MTSLPLWVLALGILVVLVLLWSVWAVLRSRRPISRSSADAYTQGLTALIAGRRREALARLKEAVHEDSDNLDAYIRLGDLLRESGDTSKALAVHRDLTVRPRINDGDRIRILESITRDYLAAGRYEEAGQSAERLRQLDRNHRFAYRAIQQVAEALEDWPRAVQAAAEGERLDGVDDVRQRAGYLCRAGEHERNQGRVAEAARYFEDALKLHSGCVPAARTLGDLRHEQGDSSKAIAIWRDAAFAAPEEARDLFERLERSFFELGQFGEVLGFYRELLHRTPREQSVPALLALAEIHRRKGEFDEAENFITEALDIQPAHPRAHRHGVKLALDRKNPDLALSRIERFLEEADEGAAP